jgi:transcriptional regulator with XRE-family HTH domain
MKVVDDLDRSVARERIPAIMEHFDINQSEFADDLEISHSYVSAMLAGTKVPSKKLIKAIKKTYRVLDYWWQTGEGDITD